jgi:ABC-type branched-subunit amino acid transport system substrate-binding protein
MRLGILYPQSEDKAALATLLEDQAAKHGGQPVTRLSYPSGRFNADDLVSQLKSAGVDALFFLGAGKALRQLTQVAEQHLWAPYLFLTSASSSRELLQDPGVFRHRVYIATPSLPTDLSAEGRREFQRFHRRHRLSSHHLPLQIAAYAAAKLLVKGLKQAGQQLSRDKLLTALEGLYRYETGLTPSLTFGPNRHLGSGGAYVARADTGAEALGIRSRWVVPR